MADQQFKILMSEPWGLMVATWARDCDQVRSTADRIKGVLDEITGGGTELTTSNTKAYEKFGLDIEDTAALAALYSTIVAAATSGSIPKASTAEFDQGVR
jgi:hypothetical protein